MEVLNTSILYIHKPSNSNNEYEGSIYTIYGRCKDMPEGQIFYLILQSINMFMGIPANLMVLWLLRKKKGDSSTSDIFILHLAIFDIFFCLIPPLELVNVVFVTISSTLYVQYFLYGVKDSSPLLLSCICIDRYMAVLHPIIFTELKDRSHRTVCVAVVWIFTLSYAAAKCVGNLPNFEKVFTVMILAAFSLMLFCNVAILYTLRQSGPRCDEMHPVKKRAFKMVFIILAIIVFNYFPPVAVVPFQDYFHPDELHCYVQPMAFGLMDISSSIQPLLYLSREKIPSIRCFCPKDKCSDSSINPQSNFNM